MLRALINRDIVILKKERVYFIVPVFLLAGIIAEFVCYILITGFILSIMTNKDFKYNIGILINSMVDNKPKYVILRFIALIIYIPLSAIALITCKFLIGRILPSYTFILNLQLTLINMFVAVGILSVIYLLSIKLGSEAIGFIFTMMMMGFSTMGIFQKSINLSEVRYLGWICFCFTGIMMYLAVKAYERKEF